MASFLIYVGNNITSKLRIRYLSTLTIPHLSVKFFQVLVAALCYATNTIKEKYS